MTVPVWALFALVVLLFLAAVDNWMLRRKARMLADTLDTSCNLVEALLNWGHDSAIRLETYRHARANSLGVDE